MRVFKDLLYFILSLQEKFLTAKLNRTIGIKNKSKRKNFYFNGCSLTLDSMATSDKEKMEQEISLILKTYNYEPKFLLEYIQNQGTDVFYIDNANDLYSIGENEGFIYPQKGCKAIYLSLLTEKKLKLKTDAEFIVSKGEINKFYFIYHFYNWYAYKHNISGMDANAINILNKYLYNATDEDINRMQLADIYALKDAIKQDKASIEFVFKLCQNIEGAKNALSKLKSHGANI